MCHSPKSHLSSRVGTDRESSMADRLARSLWQLSVCSAIRVPPSRTLSRASPPPTVLSFATGYSDTGERSGHRTQDTVIALEDLNDGFICEGGTTRAT